MSDHCHDWEPGGLGCSCAEFSALGRCPTDCLGDFTPQGRKWATKLSEGESISLGLCEGHGTDVFLLNRGGALFVHHATGLEGLQFKPMRPWLPAAEA